MITDLMRSSIDKIENGQVVEGLAELQVFIDHLKQSLRIEDQLWLEGAYYTSKKKFQKGMLD